MCLMYVFFYNLSQNQQILLNESYTLEHKPFHYHTLMKVIIFQDLDRFLNCLKKVFKNLYFKRVTPIALKYSPSKNKIDNNKLQQSR